MPKLINFESQTAEIETGRDGEVAEWLRGFTVFGWFFGVLKYRTFWGLTRYRLISGRVA